MSFLLRRIFIFFVFFGAFFSLQAELVWPTESKKFAERADKLSILQPTASGVPDSGAFGDVRNNGYRFHEGIDIRPERRNKKGEPLDEVYAAIDGEVRLINTVAGNSGFGRYVVITHGGVLDADIYTLYAHLSEIDSDISVGAKIKAGDKIGVMGRSASYSIGKQQAHLHFEIGVRLSDKFDSWYYSSKKFKERNFFGNYNGMNLEGFDGYAFFETARDGKISSVSSYIKALPTAFVVRIYTRKTPDFVKIYPALCDLQGPPYGWDIYFTWHGMPQKITRIPDPREGAREGEVEISAYNPAELTRKCRKMIDFDKRGHPHPSKLLKETLVKMLK